MDTKLLHGAAPESVARCNQDTEIVLEEPEADFAEVRGLSNAVDADERHGERVALARCGTVDFSQLRTYREEQVGRSVRREDSRDGV